MKKRIRTITAISVFCAVLLSAMLSGGCREGYTRESGVIWNTTWHAAWHGPENLRDSILKVLSEVDASLNVFDSCSVVSRVNISEAHSVDTHFAKVYRKAKEVHKLSGGLFDPTVSPVVKAWGFGPGHELTADTARVDSMLVFVGLGKTSLHGDLIVKRDPRLTFNFSGIAKGYACDAVGEMFRRNGVEDWLMEIGGEIALNGESPKGGKWTISVDAPVESDTSVVHDSFMVVELSEGGMATSGNYRNFRESGGKRFGHTVSPLTGRPVRTDVVSATVIAGTAMEADALATAIMAGGKEMARYIAGESGAGVMVILEDGTSWKSEGFMSAQ